MENPFADLIPKSEEPKQNMGQGFVSDQSSNPYADLIPSKSPSGFGSALASTGSPQTFGSIGESISKLYPQETNQTQPEIDNPIENALRNFASSAATTTLNSIGGAIRYFGGAQQKDLKMAQDELAQAKASGASQDKIDEIQGKIDKFNQQIPEVQNAAKSIADLSSQYPAAYGVSPEDKSVSAQIGRGLGGVTAMIPSMATGPAGMALGALQGASQAYEETYQGTIQRLQAQGMTDQSLIDDQAQKEATKAAVKTAPSLAAYLVGGKLASEGVSKLLSTQTPLIQGIAGAIAGSVANTAAGATIRKFMGESAMPTPESLTQDIAFGLFHGIGTGVEAQEKLRQLKEEQERINKQTGGPAPEVAPSANPIVNQREEQILVSADAQAPVPQTPVVETPVINLEPVTPETPAPAADDLYALTTEQLFHEEGSPEYNAIQEKIDALTKPAEAPVAEAPTEEPTNAVQEPSTTEAMLRPESAGEGEGVELPRVGEEKPEVPSQEVEKPKEEVALSEPSKPEEVKSSLPKEIQKEFTDFAKKKGGLNKAQAQKALIEYEKTGNIIIGDKGEMLFTKPEHFTRESLREAAGVEEKAPESKSKPIRDIIDRFENAGEEDKINTLKGLGEEIRDLANKTKNEVLGNLASEIEDAVDHGAEIEDAKDLVNRALADLEREANKIDAPKEKKAVAAKKTLKDKAEKVFGSSAGALKDIWENKILHPLDYKKRVEAGIIEKGGEYDQDFKALPKEVRDLIFSRDKGNTPDRIAQVRGYDKPDQLWEEIWNAIDSAKRENEQRIAREKFEKEAIENFNRIKQLEKTNPEAAAAKEEEEVRKYLVDRLKKEGGYFTLPQIIYDAAINVGRSISKSSRDFKSWSSQMISRLGDGISKFLRQIYHSISTGGGRFLERGATRGAIDLSGEERFKPKAPSQREEFAKKAYDAIVKNTGKPPTEEQMSQLLSRKFPGITSRESSDVFASASGKPKPPTPYAGVVAAAEETPEQISIRTKDQEDQVRRGILTSVVPSGEGTSISGIIDQGNANLKNGADPFEALQKAKTGDFDSLTTARAYAQALAKRVSDALKKFGPQSKEYRDLAEQYQDYYEGIREAGTVASDILRTFQGETNLSDAADIAREYTKITGQEPTLSQHEQIRKIADNVDTKIKEAGEATQKVRDTLDESLSDVDVKTPESVEESQQQIADLSDAQAKAAKEEIDRLNNELEQTRKDLEKAKQRTTVDPSALRDEYQREVNDLKKQLAETEKQNPLVKRIMDRVSSSLDSQYDQAIKRIRQRQREGRLFTGVDPSSLPDNIIVGAYHLKNAAGDFAKWSSEVVKTLGEAIKPHLKKLWENSNKKFDEEVDKTGLAGASTVKKTVRKAASKAKPVEKMTPAEKAADSLSKRIAQAQKKIDDLNSGKVTTPKEIEKVTNDEIQRLEAEYDQKKKDLADARLRAKQRDLFAKDKIGYDLNPQQVKTLWETAKKFYLDKGESDWDKMVNDLASDLGLTPDQVRKGLASPKGAKKASDDMYLKQRSRQIALDEAQRWLTNQKASWIGRVFGAVAEKTFKLAIFGHGTAFIGTHAPSTLYTNFRPAFKAWMKGLSYSFQGKDGRIKNIIDNKDLIYRPNWTIARRAGLENDPRETRREGATPARSDTALAKALDTISGGRGFDALFHLRQDMFDQAWNQLSVTMRTPEMAEIFADKINNATGFTKGGERTKGILQSPITKILFFAPKLIASRFKWMIQDPARMLGTFAKMANPLVKVSPEERMSAIYEAKNKAKFLGVLTGTLLANQALLSLAGSNQKINFTDPKKNDWLAYKGFGYNLSTIGAYTRIARLLAQEYNAIFGNLSRIQKARGGREAAMKDAIYTYIRSGFSPITRDIIVGATGKDYLGNTVPWSNEKPDRGRRKLTWKEVIQEQFAPIPISEAATQKEPLPAAAKAASAAFFGTRLETPADIEEYEKSLRSRQRTSRGNQ